MIAFVASTASAQQSADRDSLAARLRRAENAIAALQNQIAEQSESGVQTRSRLHLEVHGRIAVAGFGNSRRVNNVDNPQFVLPDQGPGSASRGVGMTMRHSMLGLGVGAPNVLGGSFTGDLDVDFHGGQLGANGGRTFALVRLRTARGIVRWSNAELLIGQESPLISEVNPITASAIGTPAFATAGNLWLWLPQVRGTVETRGFVRFGLQAAVLAPTSGDGVGLFETDYDLAERSQRPYVQARVRARWGEGMNPSEAGCGVHQGWLAAALELEETRAVACDALLPIEEWLDFRAEYFTGQALRGLGGGGIGQNFLPGNRPLETRGGWAQVNVRPVDMLRLGVGCGTDQPDASGFGRTRNDACATYFLARPGGPLFAGAEWRRLRTAYGSTRYTNDHVTLSAGFEF